MRATFSGAMPMPLSATSTLTVSRSEAAVRSVMRPPSGMASRAFEQQVGEDLLELAGVAVDGRQVVGVLARDLDAALAQLRLQQLQRVVEDAVRDSRRRTR